MSRAPFSSPVKQQQLRPRSAPGAPRRPGALSRRIEDGTLRSLEASFEAAAITPQTVTLDVIVTVYGVDSAVEHVTCEKNTDNALEPYNLSGKWDSLSDCVYHLSGPELDKNSPQHIQYADWGIIMPQEDCDGKLHASYSPAHDQYMTCTCKRIQIFIVETKTQ